MPQSIQDFYRVAQEREFSRKFMMRVRSIGENTFNEDDFVYITTKNLPDRSIENKTAPYMGLVFNVPGTTTYPSSDSWTVQFRADRLGIIRAKLENWMERIFSDETSVGDINIKGRDRVIQLDLIGDGGDGDVIATYKLYGVYVRQLGSMTYDSTDSGEIQTFDAVLSYHFWRKEVGVGSRRGVNGNVSVNGDVNVNVGGVNVNVGGGITL